MKPRVSALSRARYYIERTLWLLSRRLDKCAGPRDADPYTSRAPRGIETQIVGITHPATGFAINCVVRMPADEDGPLPVAIFSAPPDWSPASPSGDAAFVAEALAAAGYATINVRHPGSDAMVLPVSLAVAQDRMTYVNSRYRDPANYAWRAAELSFLIDTLAEWNTDGPWQNRFDLSRIGMSGHSFGALSALELSGLRQPPELVSRKDPRVRAVIAYSGVGLDDDLPDGTYSDMATPVLYMTARGDFSYGTGHQARHKLVPFWRSGAPGQYALMLKGGDHHTLSGARLAKGNASTRERLCHQWMRSIVLAFWDAYLRDDPAARRWLDQDCARLLKGDGWFKLK